LPENAVMRLVVISIGRLKQGPERELAERYRERFDDIGRKLGFRGLEIQEIPESRARDAVTRMAEEAAAISAAIPAKSVLVVLDERGDNIDSAAFARHLGRWRDEQVANTIFAIGGADGLSPDLRRKAKLRIAFGSATWPHQMVRVMLLEQVYRAGTILAGHPYHRA
jgi:23S rRNA (pseudouridine1915-N3)-methyltransferase